jgi:hypothetical protein
MQACQRSRLDACPSETLAWSPDGARLVYAALNGGIYCQVGQEAFRGDSATPRHARARTCLSICGGGFVRPRLPHVCRT